MAASEADAYLIEAVQSGDQDAWRTIIERYQGRLLSFSRRMLAQKSEAEDVVQETFLGLTRSIARYDKSRSLETYLFAILRHKLNDQFRKLQRGRTRQSLETLDLDDSPETWLSADTPSRYVLEKEAVESQRGALVDCLRAWVEQCHAAQRFQELTVIEMLVVLGLRNKEVAADLGLSETAVAGVKFRVLERWRQATQACKTSHEWQEADLARDSTVGRIWREECVSCMKRSTLGRYLLGALDEDWEAYVNFHVEVAGCDVCSANLDDLRSEDERDEQARSELRERCFASSVGFLSHRPE